MKNNKSVESRLRLYQAVIDNLVDHFNSTIENEYSDIDVCAYELYNYGESGPILPAVKGYMGRVLQLPFIARQIQPKFPTGLMKVIIRNDIENSNINYCVTLSFGGSDAYSFDDVVSIDVTEYEYLEQIDYACNMIIDDVLRANNHIVELVEKAEAVIEAAHTQCLIAKESIPMVLSTAITLLNNKK